MNRLLLMLASTLCAATAAAPAVGQVRIPQDCRETLPTEISVQMRVQGRTDAEIAATLRTKASVDAIQKTLGTMVKSRAQIDLSAEHGSASGSRTESRFMQRMTAQAGGLVSLTVASEVIGADVATLTGSALVCIPRDPSMLRETVTVTKFLSSRDEPLSDGVNALQAVFSTSNSFVITTEQDVADWVIDGKIDEVDVRPVNNSPGSALSAKPSIIGDDQVNDVQRIRVNLTVMAHRDDGTVITQTLNEFRNVPSNRDPLDAINLYVPGLLKKAAEDLHAKLLAARPGAPPAHGGGAPAGVNPAKPTW